MSNDFSLQAGEKLLRKDPVSLVEGNLASRTGVCYLTSQRVVVDSESLLVGVFGIVSIIFRAILQKMNRFGTRRQEVDLRQLTRVSLGKYGVNKTINIPLYDGSSVRMVFSAKTRTRWLEALDQALNDLGMERVSEGGESWMVQRAV